MTPQLPPNFDLLVSRQLCKLSFYEFVKEFWDTIIADPPVWNWHIEYLCNEVQKIIEQVGEGRPKEFDYTIINISPGESKTSICTIFSTVWGWVRFPHLRYICSTYSLALSEQSADKVVTMIESDKFKQYYPELQFEGGKSNIRTKGRNGQRYITATSGTVTGVHAHLRIVDDPMNVRLAASEVERNNANTFVAETLSSRNVDIKVTTTLIIMQRLHEEDTTGFLLEKEGLRINHICLPAEETDDIKPAWLRQFYQGGMMNALRNTKESLNNMRIQLGTYGYSGQFMQRPSPAEGGLLKKSWFEIVDKAVPRHATIKGKIDSAYTAKTTNDPTGILSYYLEGGFLWITDFDTQHMEFPELKKYLPIYWKKRGYTHRSMMKIEPKASGISIYQELKALPGINIVLDKAPKDDKITRANSISALCESGKVKLHKGTWNEAFLDQLAAFPNAKHDEAVDLLASAVAEEFIGKRKDYRFKRIN